jgi:hypothetical protein
MTNAIQETGVKSRNARDFYNIGTLDLRKTRAKVKLPVTREGMISIENKIPSSYQMVLLKSGNEVRPLGEVKADRPFILHEELMDWLCEEFDKFGVKFGLQINNVSQGNFSLFQQYVFDHYIGTPDRQKISPSALIKNSFVGGSAFELHFGTYRYVCANGAIHTEKELVHITANSKNWTGLRKNGLYGILEKAFASYKNVSEFFRLLYDMSFSEKFEKLFSPGLLPIGLRKQVLASLELSEDITVNIDVLRKKVKSKSRYLKEENLVNIRESISLESDLSMWDVYNRFTNYTSNQLSSGGGMLNANRHIDYAFSVIAGRKAERGKANRLILKK